MAGGGFEPPTSGLWARKHELFVRFFRSTIYVFLSVAQGLNEIGMMTMVIMMITDSATFCYSRVRMQVKSGLMILRCRCRSYGRLHQVATMLTLTETASKCWTDLTHLGNYQACARHVRPAFVSPSADLPLLRAETVRHTEDPCVASSSFRVAVQLLTAPIRRVIHTLPSPATPAQPEIGRIHHSSQSGLAYMLSSLRDAKTGPSPSTADLTASR